MIIYIPYISNRNTRTFYKADNTKSDLVIRGLYCNLINRAGQVEYRPREFFYTERLYLLRISTAANDHQVYRIS